MQEKLTLETLSGGDVMRMVDAELQKVDTAFEVAGSGAGKGRVILQLDIEAFLGGNRNVTAKVTSKMPELVKTAWVIRAQREGDALRVCDPEVARIEAEEAALTKQANAAKAAKKDKAARKKANAEAATRRPEGFQNGEKVLIILGTDENSRETAGAIVLDRESGENGAYYVDAGQGRVRVEASEVEAFSEPTLPIDWVA